MNPQGPSAQATSQRQQRPGERHVQAPAPGMRPLGMGRCGSLMASTWRSNQSFTAWLVAHTSGPASTTPPSSTCMRPSSGMPEATTPHPKAHMGGNQVIGLKSSAIAEGAGSGMPPMVNLDGSNVNRG